MYIVRFVRKDGKADEEYYYQSLNDAEYHFHLFDNDDSGLYKWIMLESHIADISYIRYYYVCSKP